MHLIKENQNARKKNQTEYESYIIYKLDSICLEDTDDTINRHLFSSVHDHFWSNEVQVHVLKELHEDLNYINDHISVSYTFFSTLRRLISKLDEFYNKHTKRGKKCKKPSLFPRSADIYYFPVLSRSVIGLIYTTYEICLKKRKDLFFTLYLMFNGIYGVYYHVYMFI